MKELKFLIVAVLIMLPMALMAQNNDPQELIRLSDLRREYQLNADWDAYFAQFDKNARFQHGMGRMETMETLGNSLRSGRTKYLKIDLSEREPLFYGNTAMMIGRMIITPDFGQGPAGPYDFQTIECYKWTEDGWKLVYLGYRNYTE